MDSTPEEGQKIGWLKCEIKKSSKKSENSWNDNDSFQKLRMESQLTIKSKFQ